MNISYGSYSYQPFEPTTFQRYDEYSLALTMIQSVGTILGVGNQDIIENVETNSERLKMAKLVRRELRKEMSNGMDKNVAKIWSEALGVVINDKHFIAHLKTVHESIKARG